MNLTASEILSFALAAAGALITAFIAGAGVFYRIGRNHGRATGAFEREQQAEKIERLTASISELDVTVAELRDRLNLQEGLENPAVNQDLRLVLDSILAEDERDIWRTFPAVKPPENDARVLEAKVKVIAVANLKGGVGKTTVSTNLAAYLDRVLHKRVLFIDADYQGSSSDLLLKSANLDESTSRVSEWLDGSVPPAQLFASANSGAPKLARTKFVTAFYSFSSIETRLMVKWLAERSLDTNAADVRFALARILNEGFLNNFDVVVVDCPPRFSTATIAALCASTHLLVPTIPDDSSLEATENFLTMAKKLFSELNPSLRLAGVIPMMTFGNALTPDEVGRLAAFSKAVTAFDGEPYIARQNVLHSKPIADAAGRGIAFIDGPPPVKSVFRELGREISERVGL
jgi:cellulose biosynthesis protein BcsQ